MRERDRERAKDRDRQTDSCSYDFRMNNEWDIRVLLTNRNNETNEQIHGRNIRSGRDSNQGLPDEKPTP